MRPDIALGCVVLCMAILGGIVTVQPPVKLWTKGLYAFAFVLLGIAGVYFVVQQSNDTAKATTALSDKVTSLGEAQLKLSEVQGRNTKLQEQLLAQSRIIVGLADKSIETATGGDSFCFMMFEGTSLDRGRPSPVFVHAGQFPLYDVTATIINVVALRLASGKRGMPAIDIPEAARTVIPVGDLGSSLANYILKTVIRFSDGEDQFFNVHYSARNGVWRQVLRLHRVDGKWLAATKVMRGETGKERIVHRFMDPGFPRADTGDIDWELTVSQSVR